jgi:hypothetical protein
MPTKTLEATEWAHLGNRYVRRESPPPEYDVTVRRGGFDYFDVTARSENAKKLFGEGTFSYEQSEWIKLNKDLKHYGYSIEVR